MGLKDLSGRGVRDLDREDFLKLFCQHCPTNMRSAQETTRRYSVVRLSWTRDCGICSTVNARVDKTE